jgi:hypothetical protein
MGPHKALLYVLMVLLFRPLSFLAKLLLLLLGPHFMY